MYVYIQTYTSTHLSICIYTFIYIYIDKYVYIYIYTAETVPFGENDTGSAAETGSVGGRDQDAWCDGSNRWLYADALDARLLPTTPGVNQILSHTVY